MFPKLVKDGFRGRAYTTSATKELMPIMLEDSVTLLQTAAERCDLDTPYNAADVERAVGLLEAVKYHQVIELAPGTRATFLNAGHILGSATILLEAAGKKVLFTGDLGRVPSALVPERETYAGVDALVTESVYGNRTHGSIEDATHALKRAVEQVVRENGTLLIPAFSLERTQIILAELDQMVERGELPAIPVFMDSPLAARVTEVYRRNPEYLRKDIRARLESGDDPFNFKSLRVTVNQEASHAIDSIAPPKVIIAGAGMSHGGRIRHHEKRYLGLANTTLLLVGYQVAGSLGRRLRDGERKVEIDGEWVRVRAHIETVDGFSAHADRDDLFKFVEDSKPGRVFVVLGETEAATFLAQRVSGFLNIPVDVPKEGEEYEV